MEELKMDRMPNQLGALNKLVYIKPILYELKCLPQNSISMKRIFSAKNYFMHLDEKSLPELIL